MLGVSQDPDAEGCNQQTKREKSEGKLGEGQWQGVMEKENRTRRK